MAEATNSSRLGSLLGDFVKGQRFNSLSPDVIEGILLHRYVDGFSDRHHVNAKVRHLFPAHLQRYRGICLDLFWDYCLSQQWSEYHPEPKIYFIEQQYAALSHEMQQLKMTYPGAPTERAELVISRMINYDWLSSYEDIDNIYRALERIGQRLRQPVALQDTTEVLANNEDTMHCYFANFFADILIFSQTMIDKLKSGQKNNN